MESTLRCPDCNAVVPDIEGPTHAYFGANAGCWKLYGTLLEKEYSDFRYMKVHRLTVDAYAVQHPGKNEKRAAQSVNVHLVALYLVLEKQKSFEFATTALKKLVEKKSHKFDWLIPPKSLGSITVVDVLAANNPEQHESFVREWAQSVWGAWSPFRREIQIVAEQFL